MSLFKDVYLTELFHVLRNDINIKYIIILMTTLIERLHKKLNHKLKKDMKTYNSVNTYDTSITTFPLLSLSDYDLVYTNNYKICELKNICEYYKLKKAGNKDVLKTRIYLFLKHSLFIVKIQKVVRGYLLREYLSRVGPALRDRSICVNDTDFATLDPVREIPYNQFYSFKSTDGNVYGCDIISLYNLLYTSNKFGLSDKTPLNPYTRDKLPNHLANEFKHFIRLARAINIDFSTHNEELIVDPVKKMEMRIIDIFQYINELGNYADSKWFSNLSKFMLAMFIREIYDIWTYRAQLSPQIMAEIVPPHGNPFGGLSLHLAQNQSEDSLRISALRIIECLVKSANSNENRAMGAYYVLAALTLVSEEARISLPWLFQSVAH